MRPESGTRESLKEACFPDGYYENGKGVFYFPLRDKTARDILDCQVDLTTGVYRCVSAQSIFGNKGNAHFEGEKINGQPIDNVVIKEGDALNLEPTIYKVPGPQQCLIAEVNTGTNNIKKALDINVDGPNEYRLTLDSNAQLRGGTNPTTSFNTCTFKSPPASGPTCANANQNLKLDIMSVSKSTQQTTIHLKFEDSDDTDSVVGEILLTDKSKDLIYIDNEAQSKEIRSLWIAGQGIIVDLTTSGRGKFRIANVGFESNIKSVEYDVNMPKPTAGSDETWRVTYGLYHIKENETDCSKYYNPAELIVYLGERQERNRDVRVTRGTLPSVPQIAIGVQNVINGAVRLTNNKFDIVVDVTDETGFKENKIGYSLINISNEIVKRGIKDCGEEFVEVGKKIRCTITLIRDDLKNLAGAYIIDVEATDTDDNIGRNSKAFDVACAANSVCRESCDGGTINNNPELICINNWKCCPT